MAFSSASLRPLGDVLTDFNFFIPDYQRGYSWGETQLGALWSDLRIAVNSPVKQHFTGNILLKKRDDASSPLIAVDLVDGQQRVVSSIALASALIKKIGELTNIRAKSPIRFSVTFEDGDELQNYFDFWILGQAKLGSRLEQDCSSYAANIQGAAQFFEKRVKEISDISMLEAYLDTLLNQFCVFVLEVQPEFDIHVAFETLNNRGKKLSHLELLKNRLIYLSNIVAQGELDSGHGVNGIADSAEGLRRHIHLAWKGIYRSLGKNRATQNHDDEFLRAHSIAFFGEVKDADWLDKVLLHETFSVTSQQLSRRMIEEYVAHLEQAAVWWAHIHGTRLMPRIHQLRLSQIARIGYAYFKPLILAAYMRAAESYPAMAVHPERFEHELSAVRELLVQAERYIVLVLTLSGRPSHLGRADINRLAHVLMRPSDDEPFLRKEGLHEMDGPEAIYFASAYVQAYIENREDGESWTDPRFAWNGAFSAQDVEQQIAGRLRNAKQTGYYKWIFTKVLLLEYEEGKRASGDKPVALKWPWDEFSFDSTVEHIYPQNSDKIDYWSEVIPIDGRAKGLKQAVVHSLGNLMLLSTRANSSLSNIPFKAKSGRCKRDEFAVGSHSETEVANVFKSYDWGVACIAARGIAMLKFAEKRWSFNLTSDPENYAGYLPLLFGDKADEVRAGKASRDTRIDNRVLNSLVKLLITK